MDVELLVGIEFCESLGKEAQGEERHAIHMGDLVFVWLPHINDPDAKARIVEGARHFVHVNFIRILIQLGWLRSDAAEPLVVDQFLYGRVFATDWALGIAAE